jgi:iron complex outermembrane receptor protein
LQGEYSHPISDSMNGFVRGLMSIYGNSGNDPQNPYDRVPSYALANLYLGVRDQDNAWEVSVYAKNLFDTLRVTDRFSTTAVTSRVNGTTASGNYRLINTTDPREFGITARFAFGSR